MSSRSRTIGFIALSASIVLSALGQLGMKAGMQAMHTAAGQGSISTATWALWTVAGLTAYVLSFGAWLVVLIRYPLSYAYPFLGLSYVLVYIGAAKWAELAEPVTQLRTVGTIFVIAGVALVSLPESIGSRNRQVE
jgi:undecaprenyl phosphate-alpha-L-ara4N flippase subunit ArnF